MVVEWVAVENLRSAELHCQYRARFLFSVSLFLSFSLSLHLSMPPFLSFTPSLSLLLVVLRSSLFQFSHTLYISLYRSLRDEAFVLVARCDARRCAVRALRVKP